MAIDLLNIWSVVEMVRRWCR